MSPAFVDFLILLALGGFALAFAVGVAAWNHNIYGDDKDAVEAAKED